MQTDTSEPALLYLSKLPPSPSGIGLYADEFVAALRAAHVNVEVYAARQIHWRPNGGARLSWAFGWADAGAWDPNRCTLNSRAERCSNSMLGWGS